MVAGKWIVGPFLIFLFVFIGGFYYVFTNSKGREHNRKEQARELEKQFCLETMQEYIESMKSAHQPVLIEKLNELCRNFEFYYIPEGYPDMRKILLITSDESMIQLKTFDGELLPKSTSLGYYALFGDEFKIKDIPAEKVNALLYLELGALSDSDTLSTEEIKNLKNRLHIEFKREDAAINEFISKIKSDTKINSEEIISLLRLSLNLTDEEIKGIKIKSPLIPAGEYGTKINLAILRNVKNKVYLLKKHATVPTN